MKRFVSVLLIVLTLFASSGVFAAEPAKTAPMEYISIDVTLGSNTFQVYSTDGYFTSVPFSKNGIVYAQVDRILARLGCKVTIDYSAKTLKTTGVINSIVSANKADYTFNGKKAKFSAAPMFISGSVLVPVKEFFSNWGLVSSFDSATKTLKLSKFTNNNLNSILFYEDKRIYQNLYIFDAQGLKKTVLTTFAITNLYSFNNGIFGTVFDKTNGFNSIVQLKNGKLETVLENFDVADVFEFGNAMVIYGIDNKDKQYKLYKYNGKAINLVLSDCYSPTHIDFKDALILNKYSSDRVYSVVKVNKNWEISNLETGKYFDDYYIGGDWLYLKTWEPHDKNFGVTAHDGTTTVKVSNLDNLLFETVRMCKDAMYGVIAVSKEDALNPRTAKGILCKIVGTQSTPVNIVKSLSSFTIESFNDRLYISGKASESEAGKNVDKYYVVEYNPDTVQYTIKQLKGLVKSALLSNIKLYLLASNQSDHMMYVVNKDYSLSEVMDVKSIINTLDTPRGTYLMVKDYDRLTKKDRDSILFIDSLNNIKNAAINFTVKNLAEQNGNLVFNGYNGISKTGMVSMYDNMYKDLLTNIDVKYWSNLKNSIYVSGKLSSGNGLYSVNGRSTTLIRDKFLASNVLGTSNANKIFVLGVENDMNSSFYNYNLLFLHDKTVKSNSVIYVGSGIKQILEFKN